MKTEHTKTPKQHNKKLKWTVEFEVSPNWVADGFDLTDDRAQEMLAHDLSYAYGHELGAKVIKSPKPELIRGLQNGSIDFEGA